jgi:hypothetical protein
VSRGSGGRRRFHQDNSPRSPQRLVIREVDSSAKESAKEQQPQYEAAEPSDVHIVGVTVPPTVPTLASRSEETPRSVATAYQIELEELMARNRGSIPVGSNPDEPL